MSDDQFIIAVMVGFGVVLVAVYFLLKHIEDTYRSQIEKARRIFATYSVPILLALIVGIGLYHDKMGYVCDEGGNNTAGWTCDFGWLLIPLLLISISISVWYWVVYRNRIDPLDRASTKR